MVYLFKKGDQVVFDSLVVGTVSDYAGFYNGIGHYQLSPKDYFDHYGPISESALTLYSSVETNSLSGYNKTCECGVDAVGYGAHSSWCPKDGVEL